MRGPEDQGRKRWGQAGRGGGTGRWELTLQIQPQASWSETSLRAEGKELLASAASVGGAGGLAFRSFVSGTWCLQRVREGLTRLGRKT